jgi:hypothetical protein
MAARADRHHIANDIRALRNDSMDFRFHARIPADRTRHCGNERMTGVVVLRRTSMTRSPSHLIVGLAQSFGIHGSLTSVAPAHGPHRYTVPPIAVATAPVLRTSSSFDESNATVDARCWTGNPHEKTWPATLRVSARKEPTTVATLAPIWGRVGLHTQALLSLRLWHPQVGKQLIR